MNETSQTAVHAAMIEKRRAHSAITEASDEEDESSHSYMDEANTREERETCTTAGLFIHNPSEKPLPLSFQRTIPLPRFWKRSTRHSMPTTSAPDILRRTGETSAKFAQEANYMQSLQRGNEWICRHCNHGNMSTVSCALCGELHEHFGNGHIAPSSASSTNQESAPTEKPSSRRGVMRRSYSAHVSTTRDRRPMDAYSRSRSMSESDDL